QAAELPDSLAQLAHRQALELSPNRFGSDTGRLLDMLDRTLNGLGGEPARPQPGTGRPLRRAPNYRGTHPETPRIRHEPKSPQPQARPMAVQRRANVGAQSRAAHRNIAGYGRFWFGLLLIVAGSICLLANVPHHVGYGPLLNVPHA